MEKDHITAPTRNWRICTSQTRLRFLRACKFVVNQTFVLSINIGGGNSYLRKARNASGQSKTIVPKLNF